jgi:hypothetical protein
MSDQIGEPLEGTEAGQPSPTLPEQAPTEAPAYVTRADLEAFGKTITEEVRKAAQSQVDRSLTGFKKQLERDSKQFAEAAAEAGFSQEDIAEAVRARKAKALAEFQLSQQQEQQPAQVDYETVERVNKWIVKTAVGLGVEPLEPTDPEFKKVNFNDPSPEKFQAQYKAAMELKAQREGKAAPPEEAPQPPQTNPAARIPLAGGTGGGNTNQLTARLQELQKAPSKNYKEIQELTAQLQAALKR